MQSYITRRYISLLITTHTNTLTVTCRYKACTHFSYTVIYPLYTHTRTYKTNSVHKYVCVCVRCSKDSVGGLSTAWMKVLCGGQRERTEKTLDWGQGLWVTSLHWLHVRRTGQWMKFVTSRCDYRKAHPSTEAPSGLSWHHCMKDKWKQERVFVFVLACWLPHTSSTDTAKHPPSHIKANKINRVMFELCLMS